LSWLDVLARKRASQNTAIPNNNTACPYACFQTDSSVQWSIRTMSRRAILLHVAADAPLSHKTAHPFPPNSSLQRPSKGPMALTVPRTVRCVLVDSQQRPAADYRLRVSRHAVSSVVCFEGELIPAIKNALSGLNLSHIFFLTRRPMRKIVTAQLSLFCYMLRPAPAHCYF